MPRTTRPENHPKAEQVFGTMRAMTAFGPWAIGAQQLSRYLEVQDRALGKYEEFLQAWRGRRHEDIQDALQATRAMAGADDTPFSAEMDAAQGWMKRLVNDSKDTAGLWASYFEQFMDAETSADEEISEKAQEATRRVSEAAPLAA